MELEPMFVCEGGGDEVGTTVGAGDGDGVGITGMAVAKNLSQLANPCKRDWGGCTDGGGGARQTPPENKIHNLESVCRGGRRT